LQYEPRAQEAGDGTTDGVGGGTGDLDVGDIRGYGTVSVGYRADLWRRGGLGQNGDSIGPAAGDGSGEGKGSVGGDWQIIGTVVLQHQPCAGET
jgi:hypothetical protein